MLLNDQYMIAGCPFVVPHGPATVPNPCIRIMWTTGSNFLFVRGVPALTNISVGICQSVRGIPAGPPVIASHQMTFEEPRKMTRV